MRLSELDPAIRRTLRQLEPGVRRTPSDPDAEHRPDLATSRWPAMRAAIDRRRRDDA